MGVWLHLSAGHGIEDAFALVEQLKEKELGIDVVHMPAPLVYGFSPERAQFEWDEGRLNHVRGILQRADEAGVKLVAPTFPAVLEDTPLFEERADRGWLLSGGGFGYS